MNAPAFRWNQATALVGGAFDPPHLGHREAVAGLFRQPGVARVEILPTPAPVGKRSATSPLHRLELARLGFASFSDSPLPAEILIRLTEWERFQQNPSRPTYTFDTLSEIRGQIPEPAFVIGTDQLLDLPTWHRFPEVLGLSHWIVLRRNGFASNENAIQARLGEWAGSGLIRPIMGENEWEIVVVGPSGRVRPHLKIVPTDAPALSSSAIRQHLELHGTPPPNSLRPEVLAYLMKNRLYGTGKELL